MTFTHDCATTWHAPDCATTWHPPDCANPWHAPPPPQILPDNQHGIIYTATYTCRSHSVEAFIIILPGPLSSNSWLFYAAWKLWHTLQTFLTLVAWSTECQVLSTEGSSLPSAAKCKHGYQVIAATLKVDTHMAPPPPACPAGMDHTARDHKGP